MRIALSRLRSGLRQTRRVARMALQALAAYKLRGIFVVAAVGLGIAALTIIVASVDAAQRKALEITAMFGPDAAFVIGGNITTRAVGQRFNTITEEDILRIRQSLPGARLVVPMRSVQDVTLRRGGRNYRAATVVGSGADYAEAWNWPLSEGRDLTAEDVDEAAKVCLIGDIPARELFGDRSPVGQTMQVRDLTVQIVGTLTYRGFQGGGGGSPVDDRVILPITTLTQRFNLDRRYYRAMRVLFHDASQMARHKENLRGFLRHLHHLRPDQEDDFSVLTADEVLRFLSVIQGGLAAFLGVTAAAAMTVGGFVLANLFYLSVSERRHEIGLRKALGAKPWTILAQFLFEAAGLTLVGGLLGLGLGLAAGQLLARLDILQIQLSGRVFVLSLGSALILGLLFGLRPARRAAALDPIAALRGAEE